MSKRILPRVRQNRARDALIHQYRYLPIYVARGMSHRLNLAGFHWDDALSEASVGLIRAAEVWNPEHENASSFATYAFWWCRSYLEKALRKWERMKPLPNDFEYEHHNDEPRPYERDIFDALADARLKLHGKYATVIRWYYHEGRDDGEIGRRWGVTRQAVNTMRKRALRILRREMRVVA